jgi:hypothetical protein
MHRFDITAPYRILFAQKIGPCWQGIVGGIPGFSVAKPQKEIPIILKFDKGESVGHI